MVHIGVPLADGYTCEDGTEYLVHSELVRGEPRFYWVEFRLPHGGRSRRSSWDGSYDRRTAQRAARRMAAEHEERSVVVRQEACGGHA